MTTATKKKIFISLLVLIMIAAAVVYYLWNKPHRDVKHTSGVKVSAIELYKTFSTDSIAGKNLYINKILEISGEVSGVSSNQKKEQVILLNTAVTDASINCTMEQSETAIKQGDKLTIKGICSGYIAGDADMDLPGDVFIIRGYQLK